MRNFSLIKAKKHVHYPPEKDSFSQGQTSVNQAYKINKENQSSNILFYNEKSVKEPAY